MGLLCGVERKGILELVNIPNKVPMDTEKPRLQLMAM